MPAEYVHYKMVIKTNVNMLQNQTSENAETTKSLRDLTVPFAIVNNFCDATRLKCRLTGFHKCISTLNYINQVHSIWEGKLSKTEEINQQDIAWGKQNLKEQ